MEHRVRSQESESRSQEKKIKIEFLLSPVHWILRFERLQQLQRFQRILQFPNFLIPKSAIRNSQFEITSLCAMPYALCQDGGYIETSV